MSSQSARVSVWLLATVALAAFAGVKVKNPGDRDYPVLNRSPADKIPISATLPEGWSLRLTVEYDTGKHSSHLILPGPDCEYDASGGIAGAMFPYQVTIDLPVSQKGTEVAADLTFDYFEPGRCEWHAAALSYQLTTKNGAVSQGWLARSLIGMVSPDPFAHTNVENLWCWQSAPPWENRGYVCNDGISRSTRASLKDIATARQGNTRELAIPPMQSARSYRFVFHDLDAEVRQSQP